MIGRASPLGSGLGVRSGARVLQAKGTMVGGSMVYSRNRWKAKCLEVRVRGSWWEVRSQKEAVWILF